MNLVRWGRHGGGAEVSRLKRREHPGEGDLAPTRYEWGGNWEGSGTMSYGRICLKCVCVGGALQFYPFL